VWGSCRLGNRVVFKLFFIRNGVMIGARDFALDDAAGEGDRNLFRHVIEQFYASEIIPPPEMCCSAMPDDASILAEWLTERRGGRVRIMVPSRGIKRKLVSMAEENAEEILKSTSVEVPESLTKEIARMLGLEAVPESIGAFDISNITGTSAVGAFVYWENGEFKKSRYRHIRMDDVKGPDDYAMMKEMIRRTLRSAVVRNQKPEEKGTAAFSMPDLVIIDGGREHLNAALEVFREADMSDVQVVGLAKEPDRVFLRNRNEPISLGAGLPAALFLRKIRDEVHRFAVRYHRKQRSRKAFESRLDTIYGMGRKRRFSLLERFGSIDAIRKASVEDITGLKGFTRKLAQDIIAALKSDGRGEQE